MIEIEREERAISADGKYRWRVRGRPEICGLSREPLLDACRVLKSMGEDTLLQAALFRPGKSEWDLRTTIGYGAGITVLDPSTEKPGTKTGAPRFKKYHPFPGL